MISLGYENGTLKRKNYYGATRKEVADTLKEVLGDLQRGIQPVIGRQTVAQFLEQWLARLCKTESASHDAGEL